MNLKDMNLKERDNIERQLNPLKVAEKSKKSNTQRFLEWLGGALSATAVFISVGAGITAIFNSYTQKQDVVVKNISGKNDELANYIQKQQSNINDLNSKLKALEIDISH
jgi:hypothetical protein